MTEALRQVEGGDARRLARLVAGDDWEGAVKFATELAKEELGPRASRQIEGWVTGLFEKRWGAGKAVKEIWDEARGAAFTRFEAERAKAAREQTVNKPEPKIIRRENAVAAKATAPAEAELVGAPKPKSPGRAEPEAEPLPASKALVPAPPQLPPPPPMTWDEAIDAMNERHAIIENVGGKTAIASWEPSTTDPTRLEVVFQSKESFLLRYSNRRISLDVPGGRSVSVPLGQWWLSHRGRRQFRGVTFAPAAPEIVSDCLNTWQGWGVEAERGDWELIRGHIDDVIAGGNREFSEYIVRWIAWAIQHPDRQAEVALVLIGLKGAGKGTLGRCLQLIFGAHAFQVTSREEVIGKFNGHLQGCILFIADEAYWGGDKRCVGRLQGMITEPTLPIERKGFDVIQVRNFLHVMMLAEPGWVIPAGQHERRYAAFTVASAKLGDRDYFRALHKQIDNGGVEAMFYDLRELDLGDWHPRDIPEALLKGGALQKQQGHTLPPLEQWWLMILHDGALPMALPNRLNTTYTRSLMDDAKDRLPRLRYDLSEVVLRNFVVEEIGAAKYRSSGANGWSFPPLAEAREAWCRRYGPVRWDNPVEEWTKKSKLSLLDIPLGPQPVKRRA